MCLCHLCALFLTTYAEHEHDGGTNAAGAAVPATVLEPEERHDARHERQQVSLSEITFSAAIQLDLDHSSLFSQITLVRSRVSK